MDQPKLMMARGNIVPSSIVKLDSAHNNSVLQSGLNGLGVGVSAPGGRSAPTPDVATDYAAIDGDPLDVFTVGQTCNVVLGDTVTLAEPRLKSDASGYGIPVAKVAGQSENWCVMALSAGVAGEKIPVLVMGLQTLTTPA